MRSVACIRLVLGYDLVTTNNKDSIYSKRETQRERERGRERALLGTTVHIGGSRAAPAARGPRDTLSNNGDPLYGIIYCR